MSNTTSADILTGMIPVAPTVFDDDGDLDLDGQRRTTEYLLDSGVDAICILANYSEQFSLDDAERDAIVSATVDQVSGRRPVMVTTSHFSTRIARQRVLKAQQAGAALVMMMPPFFGATMRVDDDMVVEYFRHVMDGVEIDLMLQDAPLSSTPLSAGALARLAAEIPRLRYAKVEVPRAADKLRSLRHRAGADLPGLFDGEEGVTLLHDLQAGAIGSMASSSVPRELRQVVTDYLAGEKSAANAEWERLLPLIQYENRQCGLQAAKILLKEGGVIASDAVRSPLRDVGADHRTELVEIARRADAFVLRWN